MTRLLVPTAGQSTAAEIADYVVQIAKAIDAEVLALYVIPNGVSKEPGELSLQFFAKAGRENGVKVAGYFREGAVIEQIVDFAEQHRVDLIVMGASNGRVVEQWISSDVRDNTNIPVLVIPYQVFD
jgi:nucleotide-binding universal stress UspA family protein